MMVILKMLSYTGDSKIRGPNVDPKIVIFGTPHTRYNATARARA